MEADGDRDWSKWQYRRTVPSARPTERKGRDEVNASVETYTRGVNAREEYR